MHHKYACFLILIGLNITGFAQRKTGNTTFILTNERLLQQCKQQYVQRDSATVKQVGHLLSQADSALNTGPFSVTFHKTKLAPSHNPHDYVSQAPYWWPDTSKKAGVPYIRRDGRRNPEIRLLHDGSQMGQMAASVKKLALAYYFTGEDKYAQKAKSLLQVWFINPATRMNPNLNYGQYIPGICDGRGIGIIETVSLTNIPDALAMLQGSKAIDAQLVNGIKQWYRQYVNWLLSSKNGHDERAQINNHGTNYDMQLADFALFTGSYALAAKVIRSYTLPRIDQQFTIDGMQPLELVRTKSWGYSTMNLWTWCKLAEIAEHIHIDLWHQQTIDGKGIKVAVTWLLPFALQQKQWRFEQIEPFDYGNMSRIVYAASRHYQDSDMKEFMRQHTLPNLLQMLD